MLETLFAWARGGTGLWWITGAAAVIIAGYVGYTQVALANRATKIAELSAEVIAKQKEVDRLAEAVRASEKEAAIQRSINAAGENVVSGVQTSRDQLRSRTATIVKEIVREPDCRDPVGPALRAAFERLRVMDGEDRNRRRDENGSPRPAGTAAPGAAPPRGAVTYCDAGEYVLALFAHTLGLEAQIRGMMEWVDKAKAIRELQKPVSANP